MSSEVTHRHGRLTWPKPEELEPDARAVHDAISGGPRSSGPRLFALATDDGRLEGPFNSMLTAPEVGLALQELGTAIRYRSSLTDRCREIAILLVAAHARSDYEWYAHEAVGIHVGLSSAELEALKQGKEATTFAVEESAVAKITSMLLTGEPIEEGALAGVENVLGEQMITEVVILVGYYHTLNLLMRTWDPPLPLGVVAPFAEEAGHPEGTPTKSQGVQA